MDYTKAPCCELYLVPLEMADHVPAWLDPKLRQGFDLGDRFLNAILPEIAQSSFVRFDNRLRPDGLYHPDQRDFVRTATGTPAGRYDPLPDTLEGVSNAHLRGRVV